MRVGDDILRLGEARPPSGGTRADTSPAPARPTVVDAGVEFEIVWYPHKQARSLLGDEVSRPSTFLRPVLLRDLEDAA